VLRLCDGGAKLCDLPDPQRGPIVSQTTRRAVLAGAGALVATAAGAQTAPVARPRVVIDTEFGPITLELAADKAPVTCANFLRYVDAKRYDGTTFYRATKVSASPLMGLVQGGLNQSTVKRFPPIAHESTKQTGLSHVDGTISMSRFAPGTADSDFFICVGDCTSLDADPSQPGDNLGFAAFGRVVEGMDVARKILTSPVSPTKGAAWGMKGQILDPEIRISSARRA
jgi:peptidyl-prolyl cis-trans isomerase A (cyclophilin A)